jgi:queuine tRNA-ribosyltransferase
VKSGELLGMMLLTAVNIAYYQELMACIRQSVEDRRFAAFAAETHDAWTKAEQL